MNNEDKEAFERWCNINNFMKNELLEAWQAACKYKQKEYSNIMDAMTQTSQYNYKLQAENKKLREALEEISIMVNDQRWNDIEYVIEALKEVEDK